MKQAMGTFMNPASNDVVMETQIVQEKLEELKAEHKQVLEEAGKAFQDTVRETEILLEERKRDSAQ